ncbi:peptidoglycan/LPS O-acetylase OafA/YrhL [Dysgonomonadaceae bacterium PH5-43]|nr:peptidoglycan/LPS O-acetylase OafA/YrhL [Dysgonomonadaceae bacterium PH5-43]
MEKLIDYKVNNFNLIRLFAAFQVLITHLHLIISVPNWFKYLSLFNGVPIFFTLSGFLIYWSYENNPNWKTYFVNRFLRLYPALICCLILTITLLIYFGHLNTNELKSSSFILWIFTQLTFIQEFTPSIIKGFGVGSAPNAALWTISVEILLYLSIPLIFFFIKRYNNRVKTVIFLLLGMISYAQNQTHFLHTFLSSFSDNGYYLIFINPFLQFVNFFFFFCFGIIVYLNKERIIPLIAHKGFLFIFSYIILCSIGYYLGYDPGAYEPNFVELLFHCFLVLSIFSFAYTKPELTSKLIGKTDISYGLYIYHFLVINAFYELRLRDEWIFIPLIIICLLAGWLSWTLVEKRVLKLKRKSLYKV